MDPPGSGINSMDPPASDNEIKPEKLEEVKEADPLFHCDLSDSELVYVIAQALLPGLSSACVDNTTGALLRSYASVAVNIRRDMVAYLVQRSETFVAESVVLEGGTDGDVSENPFDVISNFIDDFAASKRNFLSRVSGWLLSDRREDRIDEFLQQMEVNGFWLMGRRESVAQTLLKNVDIKNAFHCNMKFKESKELDEHISHCSFRSIICGNEGCDARFSACHLEEHESTCPFEIIQCEQKCPETIMRREMDKHCITVCTMKLVNCPLYQFGCHATIPQCKIDEHLMDNLQDHILHVLRTSHKGLSEDSLKKRLDEIEKISSLDNLASLCDARSLTNAIKNYESKLGPMEEIKVEPESNVIEGQLKENQGRTSSSSSEDNLELSQNNEKVLESPITNTEPKESHEKKDLVGSGVSASLQEKNPDKSPKEKERHENSSPRKEENVVIESHIEIPKNLHNVMEEDKHSRSSSDSEIVESHTKIEKLSESSDESEQHEKLGTKKYEEDDSLLKRHVLEDSIVNVNEHELDQDAKFQKSTTQAVKPIDDFVEEQRRSTSSSDKSTSPAKRDGQSNKNEGKISSSSSEDNMEIPHNIGKVLESIVTKPEPNESPIEKDLVGSPASIKEVINEIVESPAKTKKDSESSDESEEDGKSPTKKYNQDDSPFKRNVLEDSLVNINEHELHEDGKFQKSITQALKPIDGFVQKQRRSTSSSDKSTSPAKRDVMDGQSTKNEGKISSSSSEDNLEISHNIGKVLESTGMKLEPKESPVKKDLVGSSASIKEIINEIVESPVKTESDSESSEESEDHEKSPMKKYNQDDSPFKRNVVEGSRVNINGHELHEDGKFQKSQTQATKSIDDFVEKQTRSTSSSKKSISPAKRDVMDRQSKKSEGNISSSSSEDNLEIPEGNISSSSSEDNLEIPHNIEKVLESTIMKPESSESAVEKDLVGSPASIKETTNKIVESPTKSESSEESEEHKKTPTKKYNQDDSLFKRHVLDDSLANINEFELDRDAKFQKSTYQASKPIDDFVEKGRRSTSSSDKSTSPTKMDVMDGQLKKSEGKISSSSSKDNLEIRHDIGKVFESIVTRHEPKESPVEKDLVSSPTSIKEIINEIVESPAKTETLSESSEKSEGHEKSPTKKYNNEDSPFKRNVLEDSLININEHELHGDEKFHKSATQAPNPTNNSTEKPRQSTSSSDKSTSPTKRDEMVSSFDNLTVLQDARSLKNDGTASSSSSEDNLKLPHNIERVLESTIMKPELKESPVKEYLVGSPIFIKKIVNEIVKSPPKKEKLSESSDESDDHEKSPTKRHVLQDSPININDHELDLNAKFQKCVTEAPEEVDDFIERLKHSTSYLDRSTSPVKMNEMISSLDNLTHLGNARSLTNEGTISSTSSEDNLESPHIIEKVLESTVTKHKLDESPEKEHLVGSPVSIKEIINEIVESPVKEEKDSKSSDESEEHESPTKIYDQTDSPVNDHDLDLNAKLQKCATEASKEVDDFIEKLKQSTSFSDRSTSPVKMNEMVSSLDNLTQLRNARLLTNEGTTSSTLSEENLELPHNIKKLLESTVTKHETKESPMKEYVVSSPVSIKEIINEIVESPAKTEKDSKSSNKSEEDKSPIKIYDKTHSPVKRHALKGSPININEHELDHDIKFQKHVTEAPREVDDFTKKSKQSTSSDKSTSPVKMDEMVSSLDNSTLLPDARSLTNKGTTSSTSSEDNLELPHDIERMAESTITKPEPNESAVNEYLVGSPVSIKEIINDIVESPAKTEKDSKSSNESEEHEKSPTKIYDQANSDSPVNINDHELDLNAKFQKCVTEAPEDVDDFIERLKQSISSSDRSTSPVKMDEMVSSLDNLTTLRDASLLTNEGTSSSTSSEDNLELPHSIERVLKSTDTKAEAKESPVKKYLVGSPVSIKEIINEIVESHAKTGKDSKSSDESEERVKSPSKIYSETDSPIKIVGPPPLIKKIPESSDESEEHEKLNINKHDKDDSPLRMHELENDLVKMNEQEANTEKHRESTSSSDKSTTAIKIDEIVGAPTHIKIFSESSDEGEEHGESLIMKYDKEDSPFKRYELEDSLGNIYERQLNKDEKIKQYVSETEKHEDRSVENHIQSISSSYKSISPVKRGAIESPTQIEKFSKSSSDSKEHETSPTKKYDQEDSSSTRDLLEDSLVKTIKLADSPIKSNVNESSSDESDKHEKSPTKKYDDFERHEVKDSPVKNNKKEDSPVKSNADESSSSDESKNHEKSPIKKYDQEHSPSKRYEVEDSIVKMIKLEVSHAKKDAHGSSSNESDKEEK